MEMKFNLSKKQVKILFALIVLLGSFTIFLVARANDADNKIAIKRAEITEIITGTRPFNDNPSDDIDYNTDAAYSQVTGYTAGEDSREKNRLVRTYDKLQYNIHFSIVGKEVDEEYFDRKVQIVVHLSDSEANYVAFSPDSIGGETSKTYEVSNVDTYGEYDKEITLYVLNAQNGAEISPKFEIQETTNTDDSYKVTLGNNSGSIKYSYSKESGYSDSSLLNYMPTVVSSRNVNKYDATILTSLNNSQKGVYNEKNGRYLTYVLGLKYDYVDRYGIKGAYFNTNNINMNVNFSQDGTITTPAIENNWVRLYSNENIDVINPIIVALPYSSGNVDSSMKLKNPGTISFDGTTANVKDFKISFSDAEKFANGESAENTHYFGTYAFTVFSPRTTEDGVSPINVIMNVSGENINPISQSLYNEYYKSEDHSIRGDFYDMADTKLSTQEKNSEGYYYNGYGVTTIGSKLKFKTTFKYNNTLADKGLKEIIKIDSDAFRVIPIDDIDTNYKIKVEGAENITEDDFEVKFVSGSWNSSNYDTNKSFDNLNELDKNLMGEHCNINLQELSKDQMQNVYGAPCIEAIEGVEKVYDNLFDAKLADGENEVEDRITKVIIQTKSGVKLPDNATITMEIGLKVRENTDITQTHQVNVVAMSSDYDSELNYYSHNLSYTSNYSIYFPNNYVKTIYNGNEITNEIAIKTNGFLGDCLKIVQFTSRQNITVTNKNENGTIKTNYTTDKNETINYVVSTQINDNSFSSELDDSWYIDHLNVIITLPNGLTYVADPDLGSPEVQYVDNQTILNYSLPYTKPNQTIKDIKFKAIIDPNIIKEKALTVTSKTEAININNEIDTSYFKDLTSSFTIYASGEKNVIPIIKEGESGSVVEKDTEFSYIIDAYNNTSEAVTNYSIIDIFPNQIINKSNFTGSYKVKVEMPNTGNFTNAHILCSTQSEGLIEHPSSKTNSFTECNDIKEDYKSVSAIKITDILVAENDYFSQGIVVKIKPEGNNYADSYINRVASSINGKQVLKSNELEVSVVNRTISGRVFIDKNENGYEDDNEEYLSNIPVTLYKKGEDGTLEEVLNTDTNDKGEYIFEKLDADSYKVRFNYPNKEYDVTLRYENEDAARDSDAYKVKNEKEEEIAEIAYIRDIKDNEDDRLDSLVDLKLDENRTKAENLNLGLISKKEFGFKIVKYFTKIDLTTTRGNDLRTYNNEKKVKIDVKNSLQATAKVYYGIKITNDSYYPGYVKVIDEDIPQGLTFDASDPYNSQWMDMGGRLQSIALENEIIQPGESKYLQVVLNMPKQAATSTFINTVSIVEVQQYNPKTLSNQAFDYKNDYKIGEEVKYGGHTWHVVSATYENDERTSQELVLLGNPIEENNTEVKMSHTNDDVYKWSTSLINNYLNNQWGLNNLNLSVLKDNEICDDSFGLDIASYGGTLKSQGTCQSNIYTNSKVRLLTSKEINNLETDQNDSSWYIPSDHSWYVPSSPVESYWLMDLFNISPEYNLYGEITSYEKNRVNYMSYSGVGIAESGSVENQSMNIRPVITISSRNIIPE